MALYAANVPMRDSHGTTVVSHFLKFDSFVYYRLFVLPKDLVTIFQYNNYIFD
jgi:hypothetical protein